MKRGYRQNDEGKKKEKLVKRTIKTGMKQEKICAKEAKPVAQRRQKADDGNEKEENRAQKGKKMPTGKRNDQKSRKKGLQNYSKCYIMITKQATTVLLL